MTSAYLFAFIAGSWLLQQQADLPDLTGATSLVPLAVLWIVLSRAAGGVARTAMHCVVLVGLVAAGFFWAAALGQWKLADELPEIWQGRELELSGVIARMVQPNQRGVRFVLDVEQAYTLNARVPSRIALMWYQNGEAPVPDLRAGQRWRFTVRLHRPHGNANPAGFDYEAWMLERGIRAVGYVRQAPTPRQVQEQVWRPAYVLERWRERVRAQLFDALDDRPLGGVIVALAIGDQQAIPPGQWQVFTRTGVNHLMSISGLHITMVASMVVLLVLRLWRRSEALVLRVPAMRAAATCGLLVAVGYAALAGFAVPAQRTVYMLAVVALALWTGMAARLTAVLAAAAALVVLIDPMAVIAPGFWLSFGAVAIIMFVGASRIGQPGWLATWARVQWAVTLLLVPFLLAMFQQVSVVSPIANAFAIPLVSLIVVPLALVASVVPFDWIAHAAHFVMSVCMLLLETLSDLPDAVWQQHAPTSWSVPLAVAGAIWMLLPRGVPARWIGAGLMLPLFLAAPEKIPEGELRLTVLDVGQGLAIVVRTREHALLYDTGPAFGEQIDAGGRIVVPYLRAAGVNSLDGMIISHDHSDHSGGAASVLQATPVAWLASSLPQGHALNMMAVRSRLCGAGERWQWDGVSFEFLYPPITDYNNRAVKDNDRSCVLRIDSAYGSVLLPGDIEKYSESRLLRTFATLPTDVVIAPHHGSRTSSTPGFVQAFAPGVTVFSMGYLNQFGHPHPLVNARYRRAGSRTVRTDQSGALLIALGPSGVKVQSWRDDNRNYWTGR